MDAIDSLLTKSVDTIYPSREALEKVLKSGKKLRIYFGVDPTGTKLHLGHSIPLKKLQEFADNGHEVILLFGTGTVLVGDPSQRESGRKRITQKEIDSNISTWREQVKSIINFDKVKVKQNAEWLLNLKLVDIINIASNITAVQLFKRDMFQRRIEKGDTVMTHEILYPLLQGYDSVAMDVDMEIGGTDQMFNMLIGRDLLSKMKGKEKFVLTTKMIVGTDGKQMSKSSGNCIWLTDSPNDMFGKVMSIPDSVMVSYQELLTSLNPDETKDLSPIDRKKKIAHAIVSRFHGDQATPSQEYFEKTVQSGQAPQEIESFSIEGTKELIDILIESHLASSKSEAKRLIEQGGVEVDGKKVTDPHFILEKKDGTIIKAGKRNYIKLTTNS